MWMVFFRFANLSTQISSVIILSKRSQRSRVCAERTHAAFRLHLIPNLKGYLKKCRLPFNSFKAQRQPATTTNQPTNRRTKHETGRSPD